MHGNTHSDSFLNEAHLSASSRQVNLTPRNTFVHTIKFNSLAEAQPLCYSFIVAHVHACVVALPCRKLSNAGALLDSPNLHIAQYDSLLYNRQLPVYNIVRNCA